MQLIESTSTVRPFNIHFIFLLCLLILLTSCPSYAAPRTVKDPRGIQYKPFSYEPPKAERMTLDNGLILYILEDHELPLLKIHAVVRTGSMYDPSEKEGLAELTGQAMKTGGIEGMTGNAVDEALESIAAILQTSTNRDSATYSLSLLSKDRDVGLDLFSRILMKPVFEKEKLSLIKGLKIEELRRISDDPQKFAFREFGRLMHHGSPRGRLATQSSINKIQRDDLVRFHDRMVHPKNVMISISGDIDKKEAQRLMNHYFGAWRSREEEVPSPALPLPQNGTLFVIPREGPQSIVILGWLAPAKKDPLSIPMEMIDFVAGSGGFRSRIFQEIRTNRGLAYSAGSFYDAKKEYGLFAAYAFTKSESTVEVLSILRGILHDLTFMPMSQQELATTKASILNSFIFSFTSADQIALQQMMLEYDALPLDYLASYRQKVETLGMDAIERTARRYLDPEKAIILVVGNEAVCREMTDVFKNVQRVNPSF
jgi:zinc protease